MHNSKYGFSKSLYYTCPLLAAGSLTMVGFSSWLIIESDKEVININTSVADLTKSGVAFKNVNFLSYSLKFDAYRMDDYGSIIASEDSSEQLDIIIRGTIDGYGNDFDSIRINFRIDSEHKKIYESLIDKGYIKEPVFNDLNKSEVTIFDTNKNGSYWISDENENKREFFVNYSFSWGRLFNYKNPSLFFDSNEFNGIKKGYDYNSKEKKEILNELKAINNASYTVYLDAFKSSDTYKLSLNSNGGKFSNINDNTTIIKDQLIYHDKILLPVCFKDKCEFLGWSDGLKIYSYKELIYIDDLFKNSESKILTLNAEYRNLQSSGSVSFASGSNYAKSSIDVMVSSSRNGYFTKPFINNVGGTITEALIGDRIKILKDSNVNSINYTGLSNPNAEGWQTVLQSTFSITIIPFELINATFNFDGTGVSNPIDNKFLEFNVIVKGSSSTKYTASEVQSIELGFGQKIKIEDVHGVESFAIDGLEKDGDGFYTLNSSNIKVKIKKKTSYSIIINKSSGSNNPTVSYEITNDKGYSYSGTSTAIKDKFSVSQCLVTGDKVSFSAGSNCSSVTPDVVNCGSDDVVASAVGTSSSGCFAEGTPILMADGTYKNIEEIHAGDEIMIFNHDEGTITKGIAAYIFLNDKIIRPVMCVKFSNGVNIEVLYGHCFFNKEECRYIELRPTNINNYIGMHFYYFDINSNKGYYVRLDSVEYYEKLTKAYAVVSAYEMNCVANGFVNITDDIAGLYNYFEYKKNLQYDLEQKKLDIEKYGMYIYSEWQNYFTMEEFELFNIKFLKVSVGKGLLTEEIIKKYVDLYFR